MCKMDEKNVGFSHLGILVLDILSSEEAVVWIEGLVPAAVLRGGKCRRAAKEEREKTF